MTRSQRTMVATVLVGHFTAAFSALGMPPFFAIILERSLHNEAAYLTGLLYVVPTLFIAISSPWWGGLADRIGKKSMLLRAQLGLAGSFLLAGFAENIEVFFIALILQGILGGTFGASSAYLSTALSGQALTRSLTLMQGSARAALVVAPVILGQFMFMDSPIELYRYLAILPLASLVLIWQLPEQNDTSAGKATPQSSGAITQVFAHRDIYVLQFVFVFATVITFPYFVPFAQQQLSSLAASTAGLLFGLPHFVYLIGAAPMSLSLGQKRPIATLVLAFLLLGTSYIGQAYSSGLISLTVWRIFMGLAMTAGFIALHALMASVAQHGKTGRTFGWLESSAKWGAVLAGLAAGFAVARFELRSPLFLAATALMATVLYLITLRRNRLVPVTTDI